MEKKFEMIMCNSIKFADSVDSLIEWIDDHEFLNIIDKKRLDESLHEMKVNEEKKYGFCCWIKRTA